MCTPFVFTPLALHAANNLPCHAVHVLHAIRAAACISIQSPAVLHIGYIHVTDAQLVIVAVITITPTTYMTDAQLVIVAVSSCSDFSITRPQNTVFNRSQCYLLKQ